MSYENAVPKPLKFLISDGKMIDDEGNVIAESDTLKDLYTKWNPEVKKYLLSDGSVVDENNNLIVKNDYYKKMYDQATPKVAKYLHSDGTIDENSGGGSADLEDNVQTIIDVSTYTQPVEVLPISGKDGMKKNTITLNNIPSPGGGTLYCWEDESQNSWMYTITETPTTSNKALFSNDNTNIMELLTITEVTEEGIKTSYNNEVYFRYPAGDISLT